MTVAALVVGAGQGSRFRRSLGATADEIAPKAFARLCGEPLIVHAARALAGAPEVDQVLPVVGAAELERLGELAPTLAAVAKLGPAVVGGLERQDSVRAGVAALGQGVTLVAVHDAARPLLRAVDVSRVIDAAAASGAAILATPIRSTVKRVRGGHVVETPPRDECWAAQTPQVFRVDWLLEALEKADVAGLRGTDDAALVERLGVSVEIVEGHPANLKITTAADLALAETWLNLLGGPG
jgi:2-C-methyl-D-erythritol 4-phosphate cytidylyltransferase